jgi:hypothetical protein
MKIFEFLNWAKTRTEWEVLGADLEKIYFEIITQENLNIFLQNAQNAECPVTVHPGEKNPIYCLHAINLQKFVDLMEPKKVIGSTIPDLQLATCKQMANELKKRENLTFVMLWIEENYYDNIHIEANGEANQIIGLVTRGLSLILKTTENKTHIRESEDD